MNKIINHFKRINICIQHFCLYFGHRVLQIHCIFNMPNRQILQRNKCFIKYVFYKFYTTNILLSCGKPWRDPQLTLLTSSLMSLWHTGHCLAMAHRTSSRASCEGWSGRRPLDPSRVKMFCSHPSSRIRVVIQGWARTQPPKACRLSLQSSPASSQWSSQRVLICAGLEACPDCTALRRKDRTEEKKRRWPSSTGSARIQGGHY